MVLHTCLPESLAGIPARHSEFQRVLAQSLHGRGQTHGAQGAGLCLAAYPSKPQHSTYSNVCMELDEKMLPLEAQFANFGPVERVNLRIALQGRTECYCGTGRAENTEIQLGQSSASRFCTSCCCSTQCSSLALGKGLQGSGVRF